MPGKKRSKNFASVTDRLRAVGTDLTGTDAQQVASVQQQVEAIGRGDFEAALAHAAPDVELEIYAPPDFPFVRRAKGTQEVRQAIDVGTGQVAAWADAVQFQFDFLKRRYKEKGDATSQRRKSA